jgi:hypothetical protein
MANRANVQAPTSIVLTDDDGKKIAVPATTPPQSGDTALQVHANLGSQVIAVDQITTGAGFLATSQTALNSSTATSVASARTTRRSLLVTNLDSTVTIYVGNSGVTSSTGQAVFAQNSLTIPFTGAVYAISASATPSVSVVEVYD